MSELINESSVAIKLGCKVKTLQAWRARGGGPQFIKVGRLVRYEPEAVQAYIERRRVASTSGRK